MAESQQLWSIRVHDIVYRYSQDADTAGLSINRKQQLLGKKSKNTKHRIFDK